MADGPVGVIFDVEESTVVNLVRYTFRRFVRWREPVITPDGTRVAVPREGRSIEDQTIDLLEAKEQVIEGTLGATAANGVRTLDYDVPGQVYLTPDDGVTLIPLDLDQYVQDAGDAITDRRGWGAIKGEIEVLDTIIGDPGDYIDLEVPHQVNAKVSQSPVAQRGGTRKVQIIGRTPKAGTAVLQLEDAGNVAQSAPETPEPPDAGTIPVPTFTLAASGDDPLTVATATVTNDTDLEDVGAIVEWQYAVSATEPVVDGTDFGPLALGFGVDTIDTPAVPSGSEVWVRARALVVSTGERSAWSAWQSITLGPDDDGTGGVLPPFLLALAIDSGGVLSAEATSVVAAITKVYFVAGAAGGAAPSYAAILAGSTDTSGPPFTAASLATMAEGEQRTVGAIGEDALGNRTTAIFASITRTVDGGVSTGTPGNWSHPFVTEAGGTFVLGAHSPWAERLGTGKYRRVLGDSSYVRGQATVMVGGFVTSYLDCYVSLDDGYSWETDLLGLRVPLKDTDDEIGSKGFKHAVGLAVQVDSAFVGDVLLDAVVVGGNDIEIPEILNFIIESTSTAPPPADGEGGPVTPELPQPASLLAAWEITETSGETIANKAAGSGGTPALIVGESTGNDTHDPTFQSSPRRFNAVSEAGFTHQLCRYVFSAGEAAALPNGFAVFFPFRTLSGPSDKYLFGIINTLGGQIANFFYAPTTALPSARVGTTGGTVSAQGSTAIVNGDWHVAGLIYTGSRLKCIIDGAVEADVSVANPLASTATGTYIDFGWPGTNLSFINGPDDMDFGDMYVWVAAGIDFTADEIAALYLYIRQTYTGLPAL